MPQPSNPLRISTDQPMPARVLRTTPAGLIVALPDGREGLVRERELAWDTEARRGWRERYRPGDKLNVVPLPKESGQRPEFSVRLAQDDPWLDVQERYPKAALVDGVVTGIVSYGCFVELEPGVMGLVHTSRFPAWATMAPCEIFWPGDLVKVIVGEIDVAERRMILTLADRARLRWRQPVFLLNLFAPTGLNGKPDRQDLPAKRKPVGRAVPFLKDGASSISDFALPAQSHSSLHRTVRGLAAPCIPAGSGNRTPTQPAAAKNKKAAQNGQPCQRQPHRTAIISAETARTVTKETGR